MIMTPILKASSFQIFSSTLLVLAVTQSLTSSSTIYPDSATCIKNITTNPVMKAAYIGWPVSLNCDVLRDQLGEIRYSFYNYEPEGSGSVPSQIQNVNAECQIWDNHRLIYSHKFDLYRDGYEHSHQLPDLQLNHTLNYHVIIKIPNLKTCLSTLLQIQPSPLPNLTCEEAMNQSKLLPRKVQVEKSVVFSCEVPFSVTPKLSIGQHTPTTHKWLRNCAEIPEDKFVREDPFFNAIRIRNASYEHSGVYTCAVMHKDQIWYINHNSLCVQPSHQLKQAITCMKKVVYTSIGQRVELRCESYVVFHRNLFMFKVKWKHANATRCENRLPSSRSESPDETKRINCEFDYKPLPCFERVPSQDEIDEAVSQKMSMTLTIEKIEESDFGDYEVILSDITMSPKMQGKIKVAIDRSQSLLALYVAIGVICGALSISFFCIALYCCCRRKLRRCGRKRKESMEDTSTITETV